MNTSTPLYLTVDSGSTKTRWILTGHAGATHSVVTGGINPVHLSADRLFLALREAVDTLMAADGPCPLDDASAVAEVRYYGAGCTPANIPLMEQHLQRLFPMARVEVASDLLGAAKALFADRPGIACILGTGSNSGVYDGEKIVFQTPAMGFILGDEGSGAVLGRLLVNAIYKGQLPRTLREAFEAETGETMATVIEKVYRMPAPNRFLASLSPFVARHADIPEVKQLVEDNFRAFVSRNLLGYQRQDLPVGAVGSIAWVYRDILTAVLRSAGFQTAGILKEPF